jgi:hypothetical protein
MAGSVCADDLGAMASRRPNECPRCGFAYSLWTHTPHSRAERVGTVLRHGGSPFGHAAAATELETAPWQCRCGAVLRRRQSTYGWADAGAIAAIAALWVAAILTLPVPWLRSKWVLPAAIALWVLFRTSTQFALDEVSAEGPDAAGPGPPAG